MKKNLNNERSAAINALAKWRRSGIFPDRLLASGNSMAMEITYGAIRNLSALDFVLAKFLRKSPGVLPYATLCAGAWQLIFAKNIPAYAAISETVNAAKEIGAGPTGLINAVLRNIVRNREAILNDLNGAPTAIRLSHPEEIVKRWERAFGVDKTLSICEADNAIPSTTAIPLPFTDGARALSLCEEWNAASISARIVDSPCGTETIEIPHGIAIERLPGYEDGQFIIQDPATLLSLSFLSPRNGETILDACAAPGGKAMQIAASVGANGKVFAFDAVEERLNRLRENALRTGLSNIEIRQADATSSTLAGLLPSSQLDAILADVPCSNSGVFRRRPDARWRWDAKETARLAELQLAILTNLAALKPKRIVYSTCSIDPEEDDSVVEKFLATPIGVCYRLEKSTTLLPSMSSDGAYAALLVLE